MNTLVNNGNANNYKKKFTELYLKANYLYDTNQYEEAAFYYAEMLKDNPENVLALCMLSVINYKMNEMDRAYALSTAAYHLCPQLGLPINILRSIKSNTKVPTLHSQYKGFLDRDFVKSLYRRYLPEFQRTDVYYDKNRYHENLTKHIDQDFLYFMIRLFKPVNVIEFSPFHGLSTAILYTALEANKQTYTFATFDLEEFNGFTDRMGYYNIPLNVITGDAIETVPTYLLKNDLVGKIDFCFVDSEHTYEFAERYTKVIFPLLAEDCVIMIHDMCYCPEQIEKPFNHYGPVKVSEITGHCNSFGEGAYLSRFLRELKGYKFFLTHRLFGGFGLLSPKLPINQPLVDELTAEVEGFTYKFSSLPNNEDRKITCMLIAVPDKYADRMGGIIFS